jgi:lipopolysaccharide cholinephosphotransferase
MPDKYLSHKYGDYMTIPPGEKQRQHNFYYLDYDLPYKDYTDDRTFMK